MMAIMARERAPLLISSDHLSYSVSGPVVTSASDNYGYSFPIRFSVWYDISRHIVYGATYLIKIAGAI